jgi:hypothetical protein
MGLQWGVFTMKTSYPQFLELGRYQIDDVKYKAEHGESKYWFTPETMRCFKSRVSEMTWKIGDKIYFISSEKNSWNHEPRFYTVRVCEIDGNIKTVGKFQEHETLRQARNAIREILNQEAEN